MAKQPDYPYVRRWAAIAGMSAFETHRLVERARSDNAPANAVYLDGSTWRVTDDLRSMTIRELLGLEPLPPKGGQA